MMNFELNKKYLIKEKYNRYSSILEIEILAISEKCYKIGYLDGSKYWEEKEAFNAKYEIVEKLKAGQI